MITLNEQQKKAVSQINGASLIISGAGTGKSTVLAAKVAAIQDYYGEEVPGILALSFTKRSTADLAPRKVYCPIFPTKTLIWMKRPTWLTWQPQEPKSICISAMPVTTAKVKTR